MCMAAPESSAALFGAAAFGSAWRSDCSARYVCTSYGPATAVARQRDDPTATDSQIADIYIAALDECDGIFDTRKSSLAPHAMEPVKPHLICRLTRRRVDFTRDL